MFDYFLTAMEKKKSKSYLATACRMLPTRLATAECSRRGESQTVCGGSALTLSANASGYH